MPSFDVLLLGIGPEGHVASLFPGLPALYENERTVVAVRGAPKPPPTRLTLTMPAIQAARDVWIIASGPDKARRGAARAVRRRAGPGARRRGPRPPADAVPDRPGGRRAGPGPARPDRLTVARTAPPTSPVLVPPSYGLSARFAGLVLARIAPCPPPPAPPCASVAGAIISWCAAATPWRCGWSRTWRSGTPSRSRSSCARPSAVTGRRSPGCPACGSSSARDRPPGVPGGRPGQRPRPGPARPGRPRQLPRRAARPGDQPGPAAGHLDLQHQPGRADQDVLRRLRRAVGVGHGRAVVRGRRAGRARAQPRPAVGPHAVRRAPGGRRRRPRRLRPGRQRRRRRARPDARRRRPAPAWSWRWPTARPRNPLARRAAPAGPDAADAALAAGQPARSSPSARCWRVLVAGFVLLVTASHFSVADSLYFTLLDAAGTAVTGAAPGAAGQAGPVPADL